MFESDSTAACIGAAIAPMRLASCGSNPWAINSVRFDSAKSAAITAPPANGPSVPMIVMDGSVAPGALISPFSNVSFIQPVVAFTGSKSPETMPAISDSTSASLSFNSIAKRPSSASCGNSSLLEGPKPNSSLIDAGGVVAAVIPTPRACRLSRWPIDATFLPKNPNVCAQNPFWSYPAASI